MLFSFDLNYEIVMPAHRTHGMKNTREYYSWCGMKRRCYGVEKERYIRRYRDRGITVCPQWRDSFEQFYKDMGPCPPGMMLDRKDNDRGYEPSNCRWATPKQQANNRRNNLLITHNGQTQTCAQWAEVFGLERHVISRRLKAGFPIEQVLAPYMRVHKRA